MSAPAEEAGGGPGAAAAGADMAFASSDSEPVAAVNLAGVADHPAQAYRGGRVLATYSPLGDPSPFWLCVCRQSTMDDQKNVDIMWLELIKGNRFRLGGGQVGGLARASIICTVKGEVSQGQFTLASTDRDRIWQTSEAARKRQVGPPPAAAAVAAAPHSPGSRAAAEQRSSVCGARRNQAMSEVAPPRRMMMAATTEGVVWAPWRSGPAWPARWIDINDVGDPAVRRELVASRPAAGTPQVVHFFGSGTFTWCAMDRMKRFECLEPLHTAKSTKGMPIAPRARAIKEAEAYLSRLRKQVAQTQICRPSNSAVAAARAQQDCTGSEAADGDEMGARPGVASDPFVLGRQDWARLTGQQRSSAEVLGYCESTWNARTELPKACLHSRWEASPEVCRSWDELEPHQQAAARVLGYGHDDPGTRCSWDEAMCSNDPPTDDGAEPMFSIGEEVLAYDYVGNVYASTVLNIRVGHGGKNEYRVHYHRWRRKHDKWIDSFAVLKNTAFNRGFLALNGESDDEGSAAEGKNPLVLNRRFLPQRSPEAKDPLVVDSGRTPTVHSSSVVATSDGAASGGVVTELRSGQSKAEKTPAPTITAGAAGAAAKAAGTAPLPYNLPRGCTTAQRQLIESNPSGLLGRFGLSGLPSNVWQTYGKEFRASEEEWRQRGVNDTNRQSQAELGNVSTFTSYYGKGQQQAFSDFKATVVQRAMTTFKLARPGEWILDISCGGGTRQMVAGMLGVPALGLDLRQDCIDECQQIASRCFDSRTQPEAVKPYFRRGDMRNVPETVRKFRAEMAAVPGAGSSAVRFGAIFTSIPFWKLETYDKDRTVVGMMEHCSTFDQYVRAMDASLVGTVDVLEENSWVLVHCGSMRDKGDLCDIPFEIKRIFRAMDGVTVVDEVVLLPPCGGSMLRAPNLFESHSKLINGNTRLIVAWKGDRHRIPAGSHGCKVGKAQWKVAHGRNNVPEQSPGVQCHGQAVRELMGERVRTQAGHQGLVVGSHNRFMVIKTDTGTLVHQRRHAIQRVRNGRCDAAPGAVSAYVGDKSPQAAQNVLQEVQIQCEEDEQQLTDSHELDALSQQTYQVEWILDKRDNDDPKGCPLYLVRWKGYGHTANSWEPETSLAANAGEVIAAYNSRTAELASERREWQAAQRDIGRAAVSLHSAAADPTDLAHRPCAPYTRRPRVQERVAYFLKDQTTGRSWWHRSTCVKLGTQRWPNWFGLQLDDTGDVVSALITRENYRGNDLAHGCWRFIDPLPSPRMVRRQLRAAAAATATSSTLSTGDSGGKASQTLDVAVYERVQCHGQAVRELMGERVRTQAGHQGLVVGSHNGFMVIKTDTGTLVHQRRHAIQRVRNGRCDEAPGAVSAYVGDKSPVGTTIAQAAQNVQPEAQLQGEEEDEHLLPDSIAAAVKPPEKCAKRQYADDTAQLETGVAQPPTHGQKKRRRGYKATAVPPPRCSQGGAVCMHT
jgi:preprotein translocase subunit YajC